MRYTIITVLIAFVVLLAACNPVKDKTKVSVDTADGTSIKVDINGDQPPIKLGFNFEMTGDAATFGLSSQKGCEMAIDELNEAGGVLGRQLEGIFEDNANKPADAAKAASKLINQDKVDVLIGCVASSNSIAMSKLAEEAKVPMVSPASTKTTLTLGEDGSTKRYTFRTCFTDDFQGEGMADFVANGDIKGKSVVLFYDAESDYSKGIYERIKQVAAEKGLTIVAEDSYLQKSETDFRSKLSKFKGLKFDALIIPGYYGQVSQIANQARELGITQPMVGGDGWDSEDLWKVGGKNIEGSYFTNHYSSEDEDPAVQGFITKYKERYGGNTPDAMAILAYDAVKVVADAIQRAGSTDKEAVTDALADTSNFEGAAGTITINETHDATKKLVVLKVAAGGAYNWVYSYDPNAGGGSAEDSPAEDKPSDT
ncbi:MAG: ABC transporter substrate-binding protein [bacterium]|nr:ABC transporter substrate-binding protein [bacterium]